MIFDFAAFDHRTADGVLQQQLLESLPCSVTFRIWEPLPEFRSECPWSLMVAGNGLHEHPVPLPSKTPPSVQSEVFSLITSLGLDLADMTARRFMRHPIVQDYLRKQFPETPSATLIQLHPSLGNKSHLGTYINDAKHKQFPFGTGWKGFFLPSIPH